MFLPVSYTHLDVYKRQYRDFGWFVSSGVGDGGYDVFAARNERSEVVAVRVVFITEDDGS